MGIEAEENRRLGELILQLAQGNIGALDEIGDLLEPLLKAIGNMYYRNRADIEDEVQSLYVKLYEKAKLFRKNSNACAWVVKIYCNSIKSHLRRRQREELFIEREISHFKSHADVVDEQYILNYVFLKEIVDKLTEEERKILIYYFWAKCTVREVADVLHKPSSTVHHKIIKLEEKVKKFENSLDK